MKAATFVLLVLFLAAAGGLAYGAQEYQKLRVNLTEKIAESERYAHNVNELAEKLSAAEQLTNDLEFLLQARTQETTAYNERLQELAASVQQLDKLSKTDRELLQKYSSVYFLNENYVPESLAQIAQEYIFRDRDEYIHTKIKPQLERMVSDARAAGHELSIVSAYRSFGSQADLKAQYTLTYGAGTANAFSAEQGFSEHQLGAAVDFTTPDVGGPYPGFEKDPAFTWLMENAHRYGFTLSYPKGNQYFVYEPWHWRYVGVELATRLHDEKTHFNSLDQREINQYLVKIFD